MPKCVIVNDASPTQFNLGADQKPLLFEPNEKREVELTDAQIKTFKKWLGVKSVFIKKTSLKSKSKQEPKTDD